MDITITVPRRSLWEWKRAVRAQEEEYLYFRLPWLPPQDKKLKKCYIISKNNIIGHFRIKGFLNVLAGSEDMLAGRYVMLITASWRSITPIAAKSHRGFKYVHDITKIEERGRNLFLQMYEELERRIQGP